MEMFYVEHNALCVRQRTILMYFVLYLYKDLAD
jgi:hypothetical protein